MNLLASARRLSACLGVLTVALFADFPSHAAIARPVGLEDLIREAQIGNPRWPFATPSYDGIAWSPDRREAAVVVTHGQPAGQVSQIYLVEVAAGNQQSRARLLATETSNSSESPVQQVKWSRDGRFIHYLTGGAYAPSTVWRVNAASGRKTRLVSVESIVDYFVDDTGTRVLAQHISLNPAGGSDRCVGSVCRVVGARLYDAANSSTFALEFTVTDVASGSTRRVDLPQASSGPNSSCSMGSPAIAASADLHYLAITCALAAEAIPDWWQGAQLPEAIGRGTGWPAFQERWFGGQVNIIDIQSGHRSVARDLLFAGAFAKMVWTDADSLAVFGGIVRNRPDGGDQANALIDPGTGNIELSVPTPAMLPIVSDLSVNGSEVTLSGANQSGGRREFHCQLQSLICGADPGGGSQSQPTLFIQQDFRTPPRLMERNGARLRVVLAPNAWMSELELGRTEQFSWTDPSGHSWSGLLTYPVRARPGVRYPLVIQTHGANLERFCLCGLNENFPGQMLASRGFAVLQVPDPTVRGPDEWRQVVAIYESAIRAVINLNIVHPDRIGMIGFSRSGMYTKQFLVDSNIPIAAAVLADAGGAEWWRYVNADSALQNEMDGYFGVSPLTAAGLGLWMQRAADLRMDTFNTPLMIWQADSPIAHWNWLSILRRRNVPVEMWVVNNGRHVLTQVDQRMAVIQLTVDWLAFWLAPEQASLISADRRARWNAMRTARSPSIPAH